MGTRRLEPLYPDVLGAITGGTHISMPKLQAALGLFPRRTFINQPMEIVLLLQNMVNQNMQVAVGVQLPTQDGKGNPVIIDVPKKAFALGLQPGEVGVLRVPIMPQPPTRPGTGFPVRVSVRYQLPPGDHKLVRPFTGGTPPSVVSLSSVELHVLQDVEYQPYEFNAPAQLIMTTFDIAPKRIPPPTSPLKARFKTIWRQEEMAEETERVMAKAEEARQLANTLTRHSILKPLIGAVSDRFGDQGMPLHPGEAKAIAKMLTYTLDEGLDLESGFAMEDSRWFQVLCQLLAHDDSLQRIGPGEIAAKHLFDAALFDAVLLGFAVIDPKIKEDLGDLNEQTGHANRILDWMGGQAEPDMSYIYLPLAMGGIVLNRLVSLRDENPWSMILELREATRGRARLAAGEMATVFKLASNLLDYAEESLRRANILPPEPGKDE
jgi:hypothetical protein